MKRVAVLVAGAVASVGLVGAVAGPAAAFNPQPEPPGLTPQTSLTTTNLDTFIRHPDLTTLLALLGA